MRVGVTYSVEALGWQAGGPTTSVTLAEWERPRTEKEGRTIEELSRARCFA